MTSEPMAIVIVTASTRALRASSIVTAAINPSATAPITSRTAAAIGCAAQARDQRTGSSATPTNAGRKIATVATNAPGTPSSR